jgi:hypothetical protein
MGDAASAPRLEVYFAAEQPSERFVREEVIPSVLPFPIYLEEEPFVTDADVIDAGFTPDDVGDSEQLTLRVDRAGRPGLREITRANIQNFAVVVWDGETVSVGRIMTSLGTLPVFTEDRAVLDEMHEALRAHE